MDTASWLYEAFPKALLYASTEFVIGLSAARCLLWRAAARIPADASDTLDRKLLKMVRLGAGLILAALVLRLAVHTFVAMGDLHGDSVRLIALESRWGGSWRIQVFAAFLQLIASFGVSKGGKPRWLISMACSVLFSATLPLLGHAAGSTARFFIHSTHILATSLWLGTLAAIIALHADGANLIIPDFSPLALFSAPVAVITGTIAASLYVQTPENLLTTIYGRTLLLKIGLFTAIVGCGWANWRRVRSGANVRVSMLRAELLFAAAVILITGALTEMAHP